MNEIHAYLKHLREEAYKMCALKTPEDREIDLLKEKVDKLQALVDKLVRSESELIAAKDALEAERQTIWDAAREEGSVTIHKWRNFSDWEASKNA